MVKNSAYFDLICNSLEDGYRGYITCTQDENPVPSLEEANRRACLASLRSLVYSRSLTLKQRWIVVQKILELHDIVSHEIKEQTDPLAAPRHFYKRHGLHQPDNPMVEFVETKQKN